ncbi:MAG: NYN domain-containing protein [Parachlamydia sp.]|nr:NYN domain-containing protein [Parachlamydia sp.]
MRYYVDGYNLLFRLFKTDEELQERRDRFLEALQEKAALINLQVTVVFDSQYHPGEGTHTHFGTLDIIFTDAEITADECILNLIKSDTRKKIVVTSDKSLAIRARHLEAKTETAEEFLGWLNKRYHNRFKRQKKEAKPKPKTVAAPPVEKPAKRKKPSPKATLAECFDYYLEVFENKLEEES